MQQKESPSLGGKAIPILTKQMIAENKVDVDTVSGASVTSNAFKEAVSDALNKIDKK